ncbi:hypothetical protein TI39_contig285g00001 [Zymoseptoria brevis]|uniref:Uncharacterized protein n=1 Tax=Zymoseptoria brevis TaxID=1047168 RepID=A0A0F4GWK6_9PEZI|nr:hypothetical protein TI39_contig285g00001 [Zymoseptoria brevis]
MEKRMLKNLDPRGLVIGNIGKVIIDTRPPPAPQPPRPYAQPRQRAQGGNRFPPPPPPGPPPAQQRQQQQRGYAYGAGAQPQYQQPQYQQPQYQQPQYQPPPPPPPPAPAQAHSIFLMQQQIKAAEMRAKIARLEADAREAALMGKLKAQQQPQQPPPFNYAFGPGHGQPPSQWPQYGQPTWGAPPLGYPPWPQQPSTPQPAAEAPVTNSYNKRERDAADGSGDEQVSDDQRSLDSKASNATVHGAHNFRFRGPATFHNSERGRSSSRAPSITVRDANTLHQNIRSRGHPPTDETTPSEAPSASAAKKKKKVTWDLFEERRMIKEESPD